MDMQGSRTLAVTQQQAWEGLNDPEMLKACIPGCEKIERVADDRFDVALAVRVGPVAAKFAGKILLSNLQPPERYTLAFEGQGGAAGFGKGTAQVQLSTQPAGCQVDYTVQAQVGGKIAQVGQRLIDGVARSMAEDFFKRFEAQMQLRHPAEPLEASAERGATPPAAPPPAPATPAVASVPVWMWIAAAVLAAVLAGWALR